MGMWAGFGEEWADIHARRVKALNDQAEKRYTWANSYGKKALDDLKKLSNEYQGYLGVLDDYGWSAKAQSGLLETGGLNKLKQIAKKLEKSDHLRKDEIQAIIKEAESWSTEEDGEVNSMSLVDKVNNALNLYKPSLENRGTIDRQSNMLAAILGYDAKSEYTDINIGGYSYEDLRTLSISDPTYGGTGARKFTSFRDAPPDTRDQREIKNSLINNVIPNKINTEIDIINRQISIETNKSEEEQKQNANLILSLGKQVADLETLKGYSNPVEQMMKYNQVGGEKVGNVIINNTKFAKDMYFFEQLQSFDQGLAGGGILNNIYLPNVSKYLRNAQDLIKNTDRSYETVEDYNEARATGTLSSGPVMIAGKIVYHGG
jgi:hypothetical protein